MIRNHHRILNIESILLLVAISGCVSTIAVEAPDQVDTNSSFQAIVIVQVDSVEEAYGQFGVLLPNGWDADSVTYTGPNNGDMLFDESWSEYFENEYPSSPFDHWIGFQSDSAHQGNIWDIYGITVRIYTDDVIGNVDIAFLGMVSGIWNGDPCTTTVEVVELNLEQSTWGSVKSQFGNL